nr:PREDICTED: histone-lysine N-methyltransferase SETD2-like [Bemisia tabaci]XP_018916934.1 PREDICTED: histone-lysine N-methyltransferase SETD2-like [Bemisia tabaci]XP_018916935.1 PREDICTED: histone-lysine N-methyltransferase SETD2-like [Bemisia tabaci]XP_018916936.1 PREDICTED: histone-lysine N-methyltransferase SETD2-like [Bemisia tabaci]XP_018916937.1 PREDICTED: histone-lysine N-methyltransferase SETD2-like [Bemisia tabaci]XP_018916938.1 PREDICTED: histone-lysine N-methyltransferase SETD2-lik
MPRKKRGGKAGAPPKRASTAKSHASSNGSDTESDKCQRNSLTKDKADYPKTLSSVSSGKTPLIHKKFGKVMMVEDQACLNSDTPADDNGENENENEMDNDLESDNDLEDMSSSYKPQDIQQMILGDLTEVTVQRDDGDDDISDEPSEKTWTPTASEWKEAPIQNTVCSTSDDVVSSTKESKQEVVQKDDSDSKVVSKFISLAERKIYYSDSDSQTTERKFFSDDESALSDEEHSKEENDLSVVHCFQEAIDQETGFVKQSPMKPKCDESSVKVGSSLDKCDDSFKSLSQVSELDGSVSKSDRAKVRTLKNISNNFNSSEKSNFRSRSGSSDTTSSESGSNSSSSVRKSSRIRSNGLKVNSVSELRSDNKVPELLPPLPSYDGDKPVKVKSRWRRASEREVEMAGGNQPTSESELSSPKATCVPPPPSVNDVPKGMSCEVAEKLRNFIMLDENEYLTQRSISKDAKRMVCECGSTKEELAPHEKGCGEYCLNRILMIECGSRCPLYSRCSNKQFQNREYVKCEVFKTEKKGYGIRALEEIPSGAFLFEYVGEVLDPKEFRRRAKDYAKDKNQHYYFMALKNDSIIDATIKGNISRFINHSCDPNAETQKWTVNGELRIGFFSRRTIAAGEELTFDYQLQRYGKEAQRCHCETALCRGWIGQDPNKESPDPVNDFDESKDEKRREKKEKERRRKEDKRQKDFKEFLDTVDPEEEIEKLCSTGLRSRADTLTLCRHLLRVEDLPLRLKLLQVLRSAEQPVRRLFLDYHGLRLLWTWMNDNSLCSDSNFQLEVLETLEKLPISNKTIVQDSKVMSVVEKWSSSESEGKTELEVDVKKEDVEKGGPEDSHQVKKQVIELAKKLLSEWQSLKELFRIPKKERIEQLKEHEREADRGYIRDLEHNKHKSKSYDRREQNRYSWVNPDYRKDWDWDRKRSRDGSPDYDRPRKSRFEDRQDRNSKERRRILGVDDDENCYLEQDQRQFDDERQQEEMWRNNGRDPNSGPCYPRPLGPWPPFPPDPNMMPSDMPPPDLGLYGPPNGGNPPGPMMYPPGPMMGRPPMPFGVDPSCMSFPPMTPQPPVFNPQDPNFQPPVPMYPQQTNMPPMPMGPPMGPGQNWPVENAAPFPPMPKQETNYSQMPPLPPGELAQPQSSVVPPMPPSFTAPIIKLPPKWRSATDTLGRTYYYHAKTRVSQWEPPPWQPLLTNTASDSSSDSDDDEDSLSDDDDSDDSENDSDRMEENNGVQGDNDEDDYDLNELTAGMNKSITDGPGTVIDPKKKRREGLVEERIISPNYDVEKDRQRSREKKKKYRELKERLRDEKMKKRRHKESSITVKPKTKCESVAADTSSGPARKIKDQFRLNMAGVIVHYLNPYRKPDCKIGRISSNEDFKHLARKLTHFVMLKELKHCRSVDELTCNDNVKHKAKDFIKKYMSKFGSIYSRPIDDLD